MIVLPAQEHEHRSMLLLSSLSDPVLGGGAAVSSPLPLDAQLKAPAKKPHPAGYSLGSGSSAAAVAGPGGRPAFLYCPPSEEEFPDLPNDLISSVLDLLDGRSRQAVSGCCTRLRQLAGETFSHAAIPVPPAAAPVPPCAAAAAARMAAMKSLTLLLPPHGASASASSAPLGPDAAADRFLTWILAACPAGGLRAETLRVRAPDAPASQPTPCQLSFASLSALAAAAPRLRRLALPLLSYPAAEALPLFGSTLTSLSLTVSDSPSLDYVLQLTSLRHLAISTRKGLLYLVLSQRQIADLSRMSSLQTLSLSNALLNDCHASWKPLGALTALSALAVSSPLSAERLELLPTSLRTLTMPFFAGSLDTLIPDVAAGPGGAFIRLTELRCRQALTEHDLVALAHGLPALAALSCDNVVVGEGEHGGGIGGGGNNAAALAALPVLRSVVSLRLSGYHAFNGLLGVVFPNLETLHVTSVTVPRAPGSNHVGAARPFLAPLPHLRSLTWPSSRVLPALLAASPELTTLVVTDINCQQRLEELMFLAPPQPGADAAQQGVAPAVPAAAGQQPGDDECWWPAGLGDLTLGFSSSLRFRPKQVAAVLLSLPDAVRARVHTLSLRDHANALAPQRDGQHLAAHAPPATGATPPWAAGTSPGRVVDDVVLAAAVRVLRQLGVLRLSGCGSVTNTGLLAALRDAPPRLAAVEVSCCPRVSRAACDAMPRELGRPFLDVAWRGAGDE